MDSIGEQSDIFWYHTELNGLPERMTDEHGEVAWRGRFSTWGETERESVTGFRAVQQNLRFQGQYLDRESGLHYNLFRYYDPVGERFTQVDPIGLAGGLNTYGYVHNPLTWIDPLGLAACPGTYDWYKYNRSQGMTATQAHQAIKNASPQDVFNYALHRQGMSGSNYPINFKEKFTAGNYKYEVRAHDVNPNAPSGSNSANGPIYRVGRSQSGVNPVTNQGYGWEYGSPNGSWHHTSVLKPNSPNYNPGAANDTHIPLPTGIIP